jgi:hypothetical protein
MKQFKKLILTSALLLVSYLGFSQTVPTAQMRIANRTTAFGQNLPAGTQIYCISDSTLWQAQVGIASTLTITTALASTPSKLVLINRSTNYSVESFEATSSTLSTYTLAHIPMTSTTGVTVTMNGAALRPTTDYTSTGTTLTLESTIIVFEYDKLVVSYTYDR